MSDLGSLSECLVDNDPAARVRARRLRSKALALSIALEALILTALLVGPLISPGALTAHYIVTPAPPYSGGGSAHHERSAMHPPRTSSFRSFCLALCAPAVYPPAPANSSEAPDVGLNEGQGGSEGPGLMGLGPGLNGGTGDRVIVPEPPRAEPPHVRPMLQSEGVMAAMLVNRVEPQYPPIAKIAHISGVVHLRAIIAKDGTVRELQVVDGNPLLARAALVAVQNWRYRPTRLNGEPVEVETYVTVNFILN
jgi:protein TonB